jgi:hypothetical protein
MDGTEEEQARNFILNRKGESFTCVMILKE